MNYRQLFCVVLLLAYLVPHFAQAQQDPFKRTGREQAAENSLYSEFREKLQRLVAMPPWFRSWQRAVQAKISETALEIKGKPWYESWDLYSFGFILAIVFGFLHIAGPGHGKIFTVSYFISRRASLYEGLGLSAMINIVDSLSAGLVVFLAYGVLSWTLGSRTWIEATISILSYGIIIVWGLWHLGQHLVGHLRHKHGAPDTTTKKQRPAWYFALGIGLIPCPISTALLIFGLLNQILGLAIFLVIGVSVGGMIAMTLLSFAVITGKKGLGTWLFSAVFGHGHGKTSLLSLAGELIELLAMILMILVAGIFLLLSLP